MKMKGKIGRLTINIALVWENDNYCEPKNFTQIDNYCESEGVIFQLKINSKSNA